MYEIKTFEKFSFDTLLLLKFSRPTVYCTSSMTKSQHKRTAVDSMFQNGILEIPKVPLGAVFAETVTPSGQSNSWTFNWPNLLKIIRSI